MRPIGGYFEWEFPINDGSFLHSGGVLLNSGRHSLEYILKSIGQIKHLWLPYYTCDVVIQPIERLGISYSFYNINKDFTIVEHYVLGDNEYLIYTNYFGIMDAYCKELSILYGRHLILDNAQAFYAPRIEGINAFYSPRKYVGVPDGGIAYVNNALDLELQNDLSCSRCTHLLKRHDLLPIDGYNDFKENAHHIATSPLSKMSLLTQRILSSLDYEKIKERRISNFNFLHTHLKGINDLAIPDVESFVCPMVYPLYIKDDNLRKRLIEHQVFVAIYWPNVLNLVNRDNIEYELSSRILPLPIDQRYNERDMQVIIDIINENDYE